MRASGAWSRKCSPWTKEIEASKWSSPRLDHHPLKYPRATSIAKTAHCCRGPGWRVIVELEMPQISLPYPSERSDDRSSLSHFHTRDQHDQTQRKVEKFVCVQDLEKLVQKRVKKVRILHHGRLKAIITVASNSPFSEDILEYEFIKKFTISIFDCYSDQSDPVQHLR